MPPIPTSETPAGTPATEAQVTTTTSTTETPAPIMPPVPTLEVPGATANGGSLGSAAELANTSTLVTAPAESTNPALSAVPTSTPDSSSLGAPQGLDGSAPPAATSPSPLGAETIPTQPVTPAPTKTRSWKNLFGLIPS